MFESARETFGEMTTMWLIFGLCAMHWGGGRADQIANCDCVPVSWLSSQLECFVYCDNETITETGPLAGSYMTWVNSYLYNDTKRVVAANATGTTQPWSDHQYFGKTELECGQDGEKIHKLNVKMIHFKHCTMPKMLLQIFETAPQQALNMSHQNLRTIRPDTFEGASNLQTLIADHNRLTAIPDNLFAGARQLTHVDFSYNDIANLDIASLDSAHAVQDFNLAMNQIEELRPGHFAAFGSMKTLNLSANHIRTIKAETFAGAHQLQVLDLSYNNITVLSSYAFENLTALVELRLGSNPLRMLPVDLLVDLKSLQYLDVSYSQLFAVRLGTFSFNYALEVLDLSYNLLEHFEFGHFLPERPAMRAILLHGNQLIDTKGLLRHALPNLETLSIAHNMFACEYLGYFFENVYWQGLKLSTNVSGITTNSSNMNGIACVPADTKTEANAVQPAAVEPAPYEYASRPSGEDTVYYRNAAGEEIIIKTSNQNGTSLADIAGDVFKKTAAFMQDIRSSKPDNGFGDFSLVVFVALVGVVVLLIYRYHSRVVEFTGPEWNVPADVKPSLDQYEAYGPYVIPVGGADKAQNGAPNAQGQ